VQVSLSVFRKLLACATTFHNVGHFRTITV